MGQGKARAGGPVSREAAIVMSADPNKKSGRTFQCRDVLWETFEQMARELECSVDYLINEAMKQYARQRNYGTVPNAASMPGRSPADGAADRASGPVSPPIPPPPGPSPSLGSSVRPPPVGAPLPHPPVTGGA